MVKKYNCASYLRLSKEDKWKKDESCSISSQRIIIESFAKYNDLNIVEEYIDDGYTGAFFDDRASFNKMIDDIKLGKINCVITKDLSRLGRELYETGGYIEKIFLELGVRYIAINDGYDSLVGDAMLGLRLGVNDLYLRDASKKVKSAFRAKQQKGEYIGSIPCYGYKKDPKDHHHLIPDEKVRHNIRMIYDLALEGKSTYAIAKLLTERQIPIPIVYKGESRGKLVTDNDGYGIWRHATVRNILTSQMYIGNMVQNTYNKVSYNSKKIRKTSEEELIIVEDTHEAIVSKEDFYKIQKILKSRSKFTQSKELKYLFTGLLKCKECGHNLTIYDRKNRKNSHSYTECNLYKKKGKYGYCTQHRLNYDWLEEDILNIIREICFSFLEKYNDDSLMFKVNSVFDSNIKDLETKIATMEREIGKTKVLIDTLYNDRIEKIISEEDFKRMYAEHSEKHTNLISNKKEASDKLLKLRNEKISLDYETCKKSVDKFINMKNPNSNIIRKLVEKVVVSKDKEIDIYFNFKELNFVK